jgi:hypothetical protein
MDEVNMLSPGVILATIDTEKETETGSLVPPPTPPKPIEQTPESPNV